MVGKAQCGAGGCCGRGGGRRHGHRALASRSA
uniref:Uncharacterized protein n=1 Tax=Arundo donax TaxID=35708 RepID=A0A0A9CDI7_ARUDO